MHSSSPTFASGRAPADMDQLIGALRHNSHVWFYSLDWTSVALDMAATPAPAELRLRFHTQWTTHGAKMREQFDDDTLLTSVLRNWLPTTSLLDPVVLYRGDSLERYNNGKLGLCWTPNLDIAQQFASGLNAIGPSGGVLLKALVPCAAVIAGPGPHSRYLGEEEFTVDPGGVTALEILNTFPPADRR